MTARIIRGDCRETLATLPPDSVQMVCTSPPYWGLRSYLPEGHADKALEIGSEPTLQHWVDTMVDVFEGVRRVLRPDGVLFLNLGDAYAGSGRGGNSDAITGNGKDASKRTADVVSDAQRENCPTVVGNRSPHGLKPKDMMGQPWRVAFALQSAGWWLRQEIIWRKPNPMPESTRDRCTKAHEHIFLLAKSERYYWNFVDFQEPASGTAHARRSAKRRSNEEIGSRPKAWDSDMGSIRTLVDGHKRAMSTPKARAGTEVGYAEGKSERMMEIGAGAGAVVETRNPRSVWDIPIHGFKGAHFATFPPELATKCITAGSKAGDTVLDPFGGAGTVAMVADRMGRHSISLELDSRSVDMARDRIQGDGNMHAEVEVA